jgi:hypothetical protein
MVNFIDRSSYMIISKAAKRRVGKRARLADAELHKKLVTAARKMAESVTEGKAAWRQAFSEWSVTLLDAVAEEALSESHDHVDDFQDVLEDGPCRWAVSRGFDPKILQEVMMKALADAGAALPSDRRPEDLVPYTSMQEAVATRAKYWGRCAADYEAEPDVNEREDKPADAEPPVQPEPVAAWQWEQLRLTFLSREVVRVEYPGHDANRNPQEMGFADKRDGRPIQAWAFLYALAVEDGTVSKAFDAIPEWPKVEKTAQELRKRLKRYFQQREDPLVTISRGEGKGSYRARFTVRLFEVRERVDPIKVRKPRHPEEI